MKTIYKMGRGLPRGEKVVVKVGSRQADIILDTDKKNWRVKWISPTCRNLEYPTLAENAVMSAETILMEDRA